VYVYACVCVGEKLGFCGGVSQHRRLIQGVGVAIRGTTIMVEMRVIEEANVSRLERLIFLSFLKWQTLESIIVSTYIALYAPPKFYP
jgi:hypothetical protein